jgi:hypothetical protein
MFEFAKKEQQEVSSAFEKFLKDANEVMTKSERDAYNRFM